MTKLHLHIVKYIIIISLIIVPLTSNANATTEEAKTFIQGISNKALYVIKNGDSDSIKEQELVSLFENVVDTKWIAKFVMGRYWRAATSRQKEQYMKLHHKFLVNSYVPKFKQYTNQNVLLKKSLDEGDNEYLIETEIVKKNGIAIKVDYKVRKSADGKYQIFDVIAEGVSLITTQRSEFASILARKGVNYLIKKLRQKTAA